MKKLQDARVRDQIFNTVTEKLDKVDSTVMNVKETGNNFNTVLLDTLQKECGNRIRKATASWNDDIKEATKEKKKLIKIWTKSKQAEGYVQYRLARRHSKRVVTAEKEASWKKYGEKLGELCKHSPKMFYKCVKAMQVWDEPFDPTTVVNNANGQPLYEEEILQRLEKYFKDLLNPSGLLDTQSQFTLSHHVSEPTILESEIR